MQLATRASATRASATRASATRASATRASATRASATRASATRASATRASATRAHLFQCVYDRHLIWYRRFVLRQPAPWTDDPIFQTFRFCNVYRELDRCTRYIVPILHALPTRESQLLNAVLFRFFNADQFYEQLHQSPFERFSDVQRERCQKALVQRLQDGETIFNVAYIISPGASRKPKHESVLQSVQWTWQHIHTLCSDIDAARSPRDALRVLERIPLVGPFLACEIWTDLSYLNWFVQGWTDTDFVNIGPGAAWGIRMLSTTPNIDPYEVLEELYREQETALQEVREQDGLRWEQIAYKDAYSNAPFLSRTNIEGALCEFRKYWNLSQGRGRKKYFHPVSLQDAW